ncbi:MAG: ribosome maturation factor RimM [Longimicrobiales bacterium]|nr:ribosome maturation factor RimM [Longimicrobiales bacterium]
MGRPEPTHLAVGVVRRSHGIRGEVRIHTLSDHPGAVFAPGVVLYPGAPDASGPDPERAPLTVSEVRDAQADYLVRFEGIDDRNGADALRGLRLHAPLGALAPLEEGEIFHHQLVGLRVETVAGRTVGTVAEVVPLAPNDLLLVRTARGQLLIPYHARLVVAVRPEEGRLVVDPPDGLLELDG